MEENKNIAEENSVDKDLEQPSGEQQSKTLPDGKSVENNVGKDANILGSKFKTVDELIKAYNNLQSEFTKKSQALSEFQSAEKVKSDNEKKLSPHYLDSDWREKVETFVEDKPDAIKFSQQIVEQLLSDQSLSADEDSLNKAYQKILSENYRSEQEIINDQNFLNEYVFNNNDIKNYIINDYLQKVNDSVPPSIISGGRGSALPVSKADVPSSMEEAKQLAKQLFEK